MSLMRQPSRRTARRILVTSVAGLAVAATVASGSDEPAQKVDGPAGAAAAGEVETFTLGDYVQVGDWTVVAHGVTDPLAPTNEFLAPDPGNRWVGVDVEVTNTDDQAKTVSSVMCFELVDSTNRSYDITLTGSGSSSMDGSVNPGGSLRGDVEFEIPQDATGLQLKFDCDLLSSNSVLIDLS